MQHLEEEVEFTVVGIRRPPPPKGRKARKARKAAKAPKAGKARPVRRAGTARPAVDRADASAPRAHGTAVFDYYDPSRFPLASTILNGASGRELKGQCSRCQTKLRLRVRGPGTVNVRCPICGHARRIQI